MQVCAHGGWQLGQLKRLCHNFLMVEPALDDLVPETRRADNNDYCRSNLLWALQANANGTSSQRDALHSTLVLMRMAENEECLLDCMCPDDEPYVACMSHLSCTSIKNKRWCCWCWRVQ